MVIIKVHEIQKKSERSLKEGYLHSKESDTGEEVHCGLEVLQPLWTAGWEIVLQWARKENHETLPHPSSSRVVFFVSMGKIQHSHPISIATETLHLLLCGCEALPEHVCACFREAATLINTPACSGLLFLTKTER